jgi:hypothetical protein
MSRAGRVARLGLLLSGALLGGCVYYNGMYNTNRLAKSARKAERDGRQFEAQSLWGQVVTRADSLVFRHPKSKYADQATVLRGLALARLNQCPEAVGPLGRLPLVQLPNDLAEEAAMALGRCQLDLGDAALADLAFQRVVSSADSARRREARFRHARALRMTGHYDEALALMREDPDPRGREDLLLALAGSGRTDEALAFADSLFALNDSTFGWDSVAAVLGRRDPRAASALVRRLGDDPRADAELRARRLYDDGARLVAVDSAAGLARFAEAARIPGPTESGERARLLVVRSALGSSRTLEDLAPLGDSLSALAAGQTNAGFEAAGLQAQVAQVRLLGDSTGPDVPQGDLRLFLGAETARDTLRSPALAAALFRRLAEVWPASPYAPKALLAAELLDPSDVEDTRMRLDSLYHDSPYLALVRGEDAPGYRVLEDSLEAFAAARPVAVPRRPGAVVRPRGVTPRPGQPGGVPPAEDAPRPGRRVQPTEGSTPPPRHGIEQ